MKPNKQQIITLIICIPILTFLYIYHTKHPAVILTAHLVLIVIVVIVLLLGLRTKPEINNNILWKQKCLQLLEKGICPFCESHKIGEYRIKIGYTERKSPFRYYFFWIEINFSKDELATSSPICDSCKDRFHRNQLYEPSVTVLEMKPGYSRGIPRQYERGHIFKPEEEDFYSNI